MGRRYCRGQSFLVFLDDEEVALNATLQIDQHVGDLELHAPLVLHIGQRERPTAP
jgi:hypothetical protein